MLYGNKETYENKVYIESICDYIKENTQKNHSIDEVIDIVYSLISKNTSLIPFLTNSNFLSTIQKYGIINDYNEKLVSTGGKQWK